MRRFAQLTPSTTRAARLGILVSAALFLTASIAPTGRMQEGSAPVQVAERVNHKLARAGLKRDSKADEATSQSSAPAPLTPEVASNYAFVTATNASLTDMSAGTTTLLAANIDDTASALTNIGFDFYFQGARFTQFGINDNGVLRLGAAAQTGGPYQPLAQAAIPLITAYGADQRTHTSGKVHFKVIGAAPNRTLVVEWLNNQSYFVSGGTADLTYQVRLSETTGVIEFVYGSMAMSAAGAAAADSQDPNIGFSSSNTAGTVGSVTAAQSGAPPPTFDGSSATPAANLYTAGTITVLNSAAQGSRRIFSFTPPTPTAPTNLTFTGVTPSAMTLNWNDSPDETLYAVYRSTDGLNFSFFNTAAQNATSLNASGLNPSTNYFWQVYAVSEGALSSALAGSQATAPAGIILSTAVGGPWSVGATWVGGIVPTATDNVTIVDTATVTIDVTTATCLNLTVGQGTGGILQYIATPASTLTVNGDATVAAGGTFTAGAGVLLTHILNIGGSSTASVATGNLTVNGTFDMNTTAGVITNFFGSTNGTLSGAGATCDFFSIVGQKGTTQTAVLDVTRVITIASPAASGSRLTVNGGTIKISSATTATPWFGSNTITGANGKLWINNAAASLQCVGTGVSATGSGSPTITGGLQIDAGTFGYGQGNNTMTVNGSLVMGGANATVNMFGALTFAANSSFTMTAGNINIDPQNVSNIAATTNLFRFSGPNTVNFTGGMVTIVDPHAATGTGRAVSFSTNSGTYNMVGGTVRFGNGVSTTAGSVDGFDIDNWVANQFVELGNVIVDNTATNAATRFVRSNLAAGPFETDIDGTLTITGTGGSRFNLNGALVFVGSVVNNGTLDGTTAASRLYFGDTGTQGTYSGTGASLVPLASFDIDNPAGVVIDPAVSQIVTLRVNLFDGTITNSNKLTIGNAAATTGIVQIGATGLLIPGGNFDQSPVWNLGSGGQLMIYAQESAARTTSFEINPTRILNFMAVDNVNTLTISGGNITATSVAASPNNALQLTNGRVITGVNTIILPNAASVTTRTTGYVDGNLRKNYSAAASKLFEVGTANGYSPVTVNATAGTFPSDFTAKAVQGAHLGVNPATSIQRYWTLTESGDITADLTFQYLAGDVMGTEPNYKVIRVMTTAVAFPTSVVTPATHIATLAGVSTFSDWTVGEISAPTAAPATISGRVTTPSGTPLAGVTLFLSGARSGRAITDNNGNYRFAPVETENFYTLTPSLLNYHFSPASSSFSLLANMTDAVFTGTRDSIATGNVIDTPEYFVRQHYLDFLGREPDYSGLNFWSDQMRGCANDANCLERRTINVSAAYFLSIEFQETGGLVDSLYRASYSRAPLFAEFMPDRATIAHKVIVGETGWQNTLRENKEAFLNAWVERAAFRAAYDNLTNDGYVDALISHTGVTFADGERNDLLAGLAGGTLTRAQVLQRVAENQTFAKAKFNEAFVRMQYFGYLRRDPDDSGFHFWLNKLNEFEGNFERAEMVKAFLVSGEYRDRFRN